MKAILKINGKEIEVEVSKEQIEKLTKKKSPFAREQGGKYFFIGTDGKIAFNIEENDRYDDNCYSTVNYCTDKDLIQQQAYREILNRLLWRWQYENDKPVDWEDEFYPKYYIYFSYSGVFWKTSNDFTTRNLGSVYFTTEEKAEQAIEEIVKPFMAEHPDFVW